MAIKNVVIPWLSGGAVLLGYATFTWLRQRSRALVRRNELELSTEPMRDAPDVIPLSDRLDRASEGAALAEEEDALLLTRESERPSSSGHGAHHAGLGALFLGRATSALSPFENNARPTSNVAGKL